MSSLLLLLALSEISLGGYLRFEMYTRVDSSRDLQKLASTLQLKTSFRESSFRGMGIFNFIFDRTSGRESLIRPIEAYMQFSRGDFDLSLGKRIITWGTGVYISPSDFVNPWDFSFLYSDLEEFREGLESLILDYYRGNSFFEVGFIPMMRPNRYPIPETFTPFETAPGETTVIHMDPIHPILPELRLEEGEFYLRGSTSLGPLDLMGFYFRGYDRDPDLWPSQDEIGLNHPSLTDTMTLRLIYNRVWTGGFNLSFVVNPYEIHADLLYLRTEDKKAEAPLLKDPYFFGALGLGRSFFGDRLGVSLDYLLKWITPFKREGDRDRRYLAEEAKKLSFQYEERMPFFAFRLSFTNTTQTLRIESMGIFDVRSSEAFVINSLGYAWADGVNVRLGFLFSGKKGRSPFTQMGKQFGQVAFLETRYSF